MIVFATVGIAVPVAIFQTSNVTVPVSTVIFQAEIVQAKGTVKYEVEPLVRAEPPPSKPAPMDRIKELALGIPVAFMVIRPPAFVQFIPREQSIMLPVPIDISAFSNCNVFPPPPPPDPEPPEGKGI